MRVVIHFLLDRLFSNNERCQSVIRVVESARHKVRYHRYSLIGNLPGKSLCILVESIIIL